MTEPPLVKLTKRDARFKEIERGKIIPDTKNL